jgi:dienelactone hydrolase
MGQLPTSSSRLVACLAPLLSTLLLFGAIASVQAQSALSVTEWRAQIRSNFFIPTPLPSLSAETHRQFAPAHGVRAEAVTYATQFGTRVPAILYLPDPLPKTTRGKIPAFIVVNGHGGDKYSWYAYYAGILYARAGAAVLTYDPIGEGERHVQRKSGTRAHDQIKGDQALARRLAGLMITDVMQAVSYLAQRPEVDPQRIAAGGYSLGSFVLALTGAIEPRLRGCVLVGGGNLDEPNGYWDNAKPMCQGLPYRSLNFLGDRAAILYALHAARGPTLIFNGAADTVVAIPGHGEPFFADLRDRITRLRGRSEGVFEFGMVADVSHRPYFVTRPVALWLEKQLDFPRWTESDIRALPETRIGDWAAKHGIALDKLYATDEREGGTPALLNDVSGFKHEDLSVFPVAEWEKRKDQLILESWLAKVRAP